MKRTVWTFGLISGAILSVMMLLTMPFMDKIGYNRGVVIGYTSMVLAFMLIFFGVRSYRDNVAKGRISFGRSLAVGSLIALVASSCYVATWQLIYFKLDPAFGAKFEKAVLEKAQKEGKTPEEVQTMMDESREFMEMYRNPLFNAAVTFIEPLPVGLVIALVSAGILSRTQRPPLRA